MGRRGYRPTARVPAVLHIHVEPGAALERVQAEAAFGRLLSGDVLDHDLFGTALLRELVDAARDAGATEFTFEADHAGEVHERMAIAAGLEPTRTVLQLGRSLPASPPSVGFTTRAFVPGRDDEAWLEVNNRAFAWHPEQGGWSRDTLAARCAEAWFDPEGFLLHETDGRLDGFCWTKVHDHERPPTGEIFVIAVDPDAHGRGLGRDLVLAGLAHLARRGLGTAMLWVEDHNTAARALYDELGFTEIGRHCWWRRRFERAGP